MNRLTETYGQFTVGVHHTKVDKSLHQMQLSRLSIHAGTVKIANVDECSVDEPVSSVTANSDWTKARKQKKQCYHAKLNKLQHQQAFLKWDPPFTYKGGIRIGLFKIWCREHRRQGTAGMKKKNLLSRCVRRVGIAVGRKRLVEILLEELSQVDTMVEQEGGNFTGLGEVELEGTGELLHDR